MKRHNFAPNGHFAEGLILYGNLEVGALASKGFFVEPPDLHNASVGLLNDFQDKIRLFLASLGPTQRAQIQWTCNADYRQELLAYHDNTQRAKEPAVRRARNERFIRYWQKMLNRELRREQLVIFISQSVESYSGNLQTKSGLYDYYEKTLAQLKNDFEEIGNTLSLTFGSGTTARGMTDLDHFTYYSRFLNPSIGERLEFDYATLYYPDQSIQELCWNGDGMGLDKQPVFYLDGFYHQIFALKRWPQKTYPGISHRLTGLPFLDYQITINIEPLPVKDEISREEKAMDRLRGDYQADGKHSMLVALEKKERKISSLAQGFSYPFNVQYLIRVWDRSLSGLQSKSAAVKNAVNNMNGAQVYEIALPTTVRKIFFSSWPGWTGGADLSRHLYAEDRYLADLLPFSSTFTAHLGEAEAIYDGTNRNLAGVRTFVGGTPQHSVLIGMTGAGKSYFMEDLLLQTQARYHYNVIIEEGLSYKRFTEALSATPIIIHPDGQLTINYLDTQGLPLNQLHIASAVALIAKMIGEATDPEKQQLRQAQIGQYVQQLYADTFADWSQRHINLMPGIQRQACAVNMWRAKHMEMGSTFIEAYTDFRDRLAAQDRKALDVHHSISEEEITRFTKETNTERLVMSIAYSAFKPEDYPTHSALIDQLFFSRLPEHKKEEIDHIATLLTAWTAGGQYGKLFDGVTNISLTGKVAHFELGYIPEQAIELKTAAGLLISGFTRQHIITLPRKMWKRIIFEEVARFLDVPGGEKIVAESYAQLRKFNCWTLSIVQQYSKFKSTRIRPVIMGNSKQFFLMRQFDRSDLQDIAADIQLPEVTIDAIQHYPLPEQQAENARFSSLCYYSPTVQPSLCGTIRHVGGSEAVSVPATLTSEENPSVTPQ
ncbi:MAG: VirB4 family type IV secretion system protein [Candidatus Methylacidiphilales bacterium]